MDVKTGFIFIARIDQGLQGKKRKKEFRKTQIMQEL